MASKKKILILTSLFLFIMVLLSSSNTEIDQTERNVQKENNYSDINSITLPKSSDGIRFYRSNPLYLINEPFNNLNNWNTYSDGPEGTATITAGNRVRLEITSGSNHRVGITYNLNIQQFIHGNITFTYTNWVGTGTLFFSVSTNGGTSWTQAGSSITSGSGTFYVNLESLGYSNELLFDVALNFTGDNNDRVDVDDFRLGTYEIIWRETQSDPIEPTTSQPLMIYVCPDPNLSNFNTGNVSLFYKVNDNNVITGTRIQATFQFINNRTITIPESDYGSSDTVYYQIWLSYGSVAPKTYHLSKVVSFTCIDRTAPTIMLQGNNATTYYNDALVRCFVQDNTGGSLKNVTMYIKNGTIGDVSKSNTPIPCNNKTIPIGGGNFEFTILHKYLSARTGEQLEYRIYAIDFNNNEANSGDQVLTITDNVRPNILVNKVYAPSTGIENNKSLTVSYKIIEPRDASGLPTSGSSRPKLYIKVGSTPPTTGNDFQFSTFPSNSYTADGGILNFTIGEGNYTYGDYIYFFVNATDNSLNTNSSFNLGFSTFQKVFANDTFAPLVVNGTSNGDPIGYNTDKTLTFTITEPLGASGIDNNTLKLYYKVNLGAWKNIGKSISKYGGLINFIIDEANYSYGDTVSYQLNVSDLVGNKRSSQVGSFHVEDLYAPLINYYIYNKNNNSASQYYENFNITFSLTEDADGSKLSKTELFVKNNTSPWTKIFKTNTTSISGLTGIVNIEFEINSSLTYARYLFEWKIEVRDNANNLGTFSGSKTISDNRPPSIIYSNNNATITLNTFEYDDYPRIYFIFYEPKQGSGFYTNGNGIRLYYHNGISSGPNDYDGTPISIYEGSMNGFGGNYSFRIPESALSYGNTIFFWVNGSDMQGNLNGTWINRKSFVVVDITVPNILLNGALNNQTNSYDQNKIIRFSPIERTDASGIKNATLYWKNGTAPTIVSFDGFIVFPSAMPHDGGTNILWTLSWFALSFKYGDKIYFIVRVFDQAGYFNISKVNMFNITDNVLPSYQADTANIAEWTWRVNKVLNFTVFDPDYTNSSGVKSITLYYKAGDSSLTISNYHNKTLVSLIEVIPGRKCYKITVYLNKTLFDISPNMYYIIQVIDVKGNSFVSTASSFYMYDEVFKHGTVQGPAQDQWFADGDIHFYFELYFATNLIVKINNIVYQYNSSIAGYDKTITFEEGDYIVGFYFLNNASVMIFTFFVDLTPPGQITDITINVYGYNLAEILWEKPNDVDEFTTYQIYRSTSADFKIGADTLIAEIGVGDKLAYEDKKVESGKTYYYRIVAIDRVGHISTPSDAVEAVIPMDYTIMIVMIVVIAAVAVVSALLVHRRVVAKKREKLFSQVDMSKLEGSVDFEGTPATKKGPQWTEIKTKAEPKPQPIVEEEIQFVETLPAGSSQTYWQDRLGKLLSQATDYELSNDYAKALNIYAFLVRISQRTKNQALTAILEAKRNELFKAINE